MGNFGPCPECGQVIARDLPRCPYCRTDLAPGAVEELPEGGEAPRREWQPRHVRAESEAGEPPEAPLIPAVPPVLPPPPTPPAPPGHLGQYRPTRSLGLALQLMFAAWMVLDGVVAAAFFAEWRLAGNLVSHPFAVTYQQAVAADDRALRLGIVEIAAYVVTGLLFIVWLRRSYRNLTAFNSAPTRFTDGWAIGAWFVPVLNLFRPKQIVDECWTESGPGRTAGDRYRPGARVPAVFNIWWGLMVTGRVLGAPIWAGSPDNPEGLRFWAMWLTVATVLEIGAALGAFTVVTRLTRRQRARGARLDLDTAPRPVPRLAAGVLAVALPLAAAGAAVPAFLAWDQPPAFAAIATAEDGGIGHYDAYGVTFDYPTEYTAAEASGLGTGAPTEQFGVVALATSRGENGLIVQWVPSWTVEGPEAMVDAVIDGMLSGFEGVPLLHTAPLETIPFHGAPFVHRTFDIEAGGQSLVGAIGFGSCPDGGRLVGVYALTSEGTAESALLSVTDLLATLSC
jgi:hypothetical protein